MAAPTPEKSAGDPDMAQRTDTNSTLERRTARGIFWRYAEEISTKAVTFVVSILLARLLVPDDYSLVSIAAIVISLADTFIDGGLSSALIQKGNADSKDYSTVFCFTLSVSLFVYLVVFFAAPLLSRMYDNAGLTPILRVLCLMIVINAVKGVYYAGLRAQLQFRKLFFSSLTGTLCSVAVGIGLALRGCGAWALVAQQLTDALIDTAVMSVTARIRLRVCFSLTRFKSLFRYSANILIASLAARLHNALVPMVVSLRFSVLDLTYYSKAKGLSGYMLSFIETPLSQVLFPALSQIKDDPDRLKNVLRKFYRILYFFTLPAIFGLYVVAEDLILLLLTEKWAAIVPYIRIFIVALVFNKNIQGIKAIGRSDLYRKAQVGYRLAGVFYLAAALLLSDDPLCVAWSFVPLYATYFFIQVYLESRYLHYSAAEQLFDMLPSLFSALLMAFGVCGVGAVRDIAEASVWLRVMVQTASGVVLYSGLSFAFNRKTIEELFS